MSERVVYVVFTGFTKAEELIQYLEENGKLPEAVTVQMNLGKQLEQVKNFYCYESVQNMTTPQYNKLPKDFYEAFKVERPAAEVGQTFDGHPLPKFKVGQEVDNGRRRPCVIQTVIWSADDEDYRTQRPAHWHYRFANEEVGTVDENEITATERLSPPGFRIG